ncbi:MAG: FAD-dependent oxidoreductase [Desulfovibrionales bacterium]
MAEKIGVYFDESSVGDLDLQELSEAIQNKWADATPVVKTHANLTSEDGLSTIRTDIEEAGLDGVVIAGTSPRLDVNLYTFGTTMVERVNLREHTVLGVKDPAEIMNVAKDYVNMGIAKLQKSTIPDPEALESVKRVMVLGGGWTGLTAALHAAKAGYEVVLIEKESALGGFAAKMYKTIPLGPPYDRVQDTGVDQKIAAVENNEKITVYTGAALKKVSGAPGMFEATVKTSSGEETVQVGAIVMATGWVPQDSKYLEPFGYGALTNVVTTLEVEEMAKNGGIKRPSDSKKPESVLFMLTAGQMLDEIARDEAAALESEAEAEEAEAEGGEEGEEEKFVFKKQTTYRHLPYSSESASLNALKQAGYVREANPDAKAYIIYEHMMVPGINELYYKAAQNDPGIMMSKGEVVNIEQANDGGVLVTFKDTLLGENIEVKTDMLVLPTGMVPTTALKPILDLKYRQGPALPDLDLFDGFADSNYICFPYETRRTGIYAAGCVRQPMSLHLAEEDAAGAALKAIQCIESVNRGMSVHPRSGDMTYPKFNFIRCTQCKRCTEECPFGVLDEDEKGTPQPNPSRCRRCGTCMGACPERVISFDNYSVDIIGSMIRQIVVPGDMEKDGPRAIILACENDAYPALDMAALRGKKWSPYVRFIPVRCLGSVNTIWIADALGKGVDGVMLLGCKYGEDYQCHFVKGSELCSRRMNNVGETLERLGVEKERVVQDQVAIDEYDTVSEKIDKFMDHLISLGPNPYKGY